MARRVRERFCFWLDLMKDDEYILADTITELKRRRIFSSTIRDSIRLIVDLRAGRLNVLLELFTWTADELGQSRALPEPKKRIESGPLPLPDPDDDELNLSVTKSEDAGNRSIENFLNSLTRFDS